MKAHVFSMLRALRNITVPEQLSCEAWLTVPSACVVPGSTAIFHRPSISGAETVSWLPNTKSLITIGASPVRNRVSRSSLSDRPYLVYSSQYSVNACTPTGRSSTQERRSSAYTAPPFWYSMETNSELIAVVVAVVKDETTPISR